MQSKLILKKKTSNNADISETKMIQIEIPDSELEDGWEIESILPCSLEESDSIARSSGTYKLTLEPKSSKLVRKGDEIWIASCIKNQQFCKDCVYLPSHLKNAFFKDSICIGPRKYGYKYPSNNYNKWTAIIDKLFMEQQLIALK